MVIYRAIAYGNWKRLLDVCLPSTLQGELLVPFSRHLQRANPTAPDAAFPHYVELPAELQLRILHHCDQPTLFQLMHTSRSIRTEAKKLFFSSTDVWYHIEADWLLQGGLPGEANYDADFLAHIEQVNLDFSWMHERTWMDDEASSNWVGTEEEAVARGIGNMDERMQNFWRTVQCRFPRVKHVILGDDHDRSEGPDPVLQPPDVYRKVGRMCPPYIRVSISLLRGDGNRHSRMKRMLWRPITIKADTYASGTQEWEQCSGDLALIVIPPQKVYEGPVGRYVEYRTRIYETFDLRRAIRIHRITAIEKHHFDGRHEPFGCSVLDCDAWFEQPEEFTSHAVRTKHDREERLPEPFEALFTENDERLDKMMESATEMESAFSEWWGIPQSEKRTIAEKEFIHQLKHDPLYAQDRPVSEHKWWLWVCAEDDR